MTGLVPSPSALHPAPQPDPRVSRAGQIREVAVTLRLLQGGTAAALIHFPILAPSWSSAVTWATFPRGCFSGSEASELLEVKLQAWVPGDANIPNPQIPSQNSVLEANALE